MVSGGNSNYSARTNDNKRSKHSSKIYAANASRFFTLLHIQPFSTQSAIIENDFDNSNICCASILTQTNTRTIHNSLAISGVCKLTNIHALPGIYIWREKDKPILLEQFRPLTPTFVSAARTRGRWVYEPLLLSHFKCAFVSAFLNTRPCAHTIYTLFECISAFI